MAQGEGDGRGEGEGEGRAGAAPRGGRELCIGLDVAMGCASDHPPA